MISSFPILSNSSVFLPSDTVYIMCMSTINWAVRHVPAHPMHVTGSEWGESEDRPEPSMHHRQVWPSAGFQTPAAAGRSSPRHTHTHTHTHLPQPINRRSLDDRVIHAQKLEGTITWRFQQWRLPYTGNETAVRLFSTTLSLSTLSPSISLNDEL
jgi:hypothetical protein